MAERRVLPAVATYGDNACLGGKCLVYGKADPDQRGLCGRTACEVVTGIKSRSEGHSCTDCKTMARVKELEKKLGLADDGAAVAAGAVHTRVDKL